MKAEEKDGKMNSNLPRKTKFCVQKKTKWTNPPRYKLDSIDQYLNFSCDINFFF